MPPHIVAVNPIGSGDAFAAGLVWRLLRGDDLGEACRWASAVGAANALTLMAGEVDRDEVDRLARRTVTERLREMRTPKSEGRRPRPKDEGQITTKERKEAKEACFSRTLCSAFSCG